MNQDIKAIIGLGNPGSSYYYHRHSIGFRILDALLDKHGGSWRKIQDMEIAEIMLNGVTVFLIKPQTYMNSSGKVIPYLLKKGIKAENILVIHDELELPFGQIKIKQGGSAKGHNGLKSIIAACGDAFHRLRVGIGRPEQREAVPDYVLENFKEPTSAVDDLIARAVTLIEG